VKIKTLSLTDFRAFPGPAPATFELDGKNLLVYGENGSGKSSLFHALQGFFSPTKPTGLLEMRNSFSGAGIGCVKVEVGFDDASNAAWHVGAGVLRNYLGHTAIGPSVAPVHPGHDAPLNAHVTEAAKFSAVLDYRSLLNTNYKHEDKTINLFQLAVTGFLANYVDLATNKTIEQLWAAVLRSKPARNTLNTRVACFNACNAFNNAMNIALGLLLSQAQAILKALSPHGLELVSLPFTNVAYNNAKAWADKNFTPQTLGLEVAFKGKTLDKPQLYLNEARQSALALALYLGARLACAPQTSPHLKLLVLDDVLVGLDHSNRLPVLNVLVDLFPTWQVVLLTHDKGWFDLARQRLPDADWVCYEIYEGDSAAAAPMPIVRKTHNRPALALLQKANDLVQQGYYEAAANYVRQAFEYGLRKGCEIQKIPMHYTINPAAHQAQDFLDALKKSPKPSAAVQTDWDACLASIEMFKNVVMNPYSHPNAPNIPRQEVVDAANTVEIFLRLVGRK
jgi:energy-coupling factor transporter ATP-binding protein EcfA2